MKRFMVSLILTISLFLAAGQVEGQYWTNTPALVWRPDGSMLAVSYQATVQILDGETLQVLNTLDNFQQYEAAPSWSPDGQFIAIANGVNIEIWEQPWSPENAKLLQVLSSVESDDDRGMPSNAFAWSPDAAQIAATLGDVLYFWDVETGKKKRLYHEEWGGRTHDILWPEADRITFTSANMVINLVPNTEKEINVYYHQYWSGIAPGFNSISFAPDFKRVVMANSRDGLWVWNTSTTEFLTLDPAMGFSPRHEDVVNSVAWSPDGETIASGSSDGSVRLWNPVTGEQTGIIFVGADANVRSVAWKPHSNILAYGDTNGQVHLVDAASISAELPEESAKFLDTVCKVRTLTEAITYRWPNAPEAQYDSRIQMTLEPPQTGTIEADKTLEARGMYREEGKSEYIWYLVEGGWIRSDHISIDADCDRITDWGYYDVFAAMEWKCQIVTIDEVEVRGIPDNIMPVIDHIPAETTVDVQAQFMGKDGLRWWELADEDPNQYGGWVREDWVTDLGACRYVPSYPRDFLSYGAG